MSKRKDQTQTERWKPIAGVILLLVGLYATQRPDQFRWIGDAAVNFARGISEEAMKTQELKRQQQNP